MHFQRALAASETVLIGTLSFGNLGEVGVIGKHVVVVVVPFAGRARERKQKGPSIRVQALAIEYSNSSGSFAYRVQK
jgi:hypothetical protein